MFAALLLLTLTPSAQAQPYAMAEAAITLDLPAGWDMTRWSDWDFRANHSAGMALEIWYTPWQLPIDSGLQPGLAALYTEHLDEQRAGGIALTPTTVTKVGALPVARTDATFQFDRTGPKGAARFAAFAGEGKVVHVGVYGPAANAARASGALDAILARLTVDKGPADLASLSTPQKTTMGFTVALPAGWRVPTGKERDEALTLASVVGSDRPSDCFIAARPALSTDAASVMFLCQAHWQMGLLDEYSFEGESALLKQKLFGKAAEKIPAPTPIDAKDRTGVLFRPEINDHGLRLGVVPYDQGQVAAWVVGPKDAGEALDAATTAVVAGLSYEGPDNGKVPVDAGAWIAHTMTYRPFHPAVVVCVGLSLMLMAGLAVLVFRKRPQPHHGGYGQY